MQVKSIIALAAFAAFASTAVTAGEVDASQFPQAFNSSRPAAEVRAEAIVQARSHSLEPAGSRVAQPLKSSTEVRTVRDQAAQDLRLGKIAYGEVGAI